MGGWGTLLRCCLLISISIWSMCFPSTCGKSTMESRSHCIQTDTELRMSNRFFVSSPCDKISTSYLTSVLPCVSLKYLLMMTQQRIIYTHMDICGRACCFLNNNIRTIKIAKATSSLDWAVTVKTIKVQKNKIKVWCLGLFSVHLLLLGDSENRKEDSYRKSQNDLQLKMLLCDSPLTGMKKKTISEIQ